MVQYKYKLCLICPNNKVLESLRPTHVSGPASDIDTKPFLAAMPMIKGITWDLDRTLIGHHEAEIPQAHLDVMKGFSELGIAQAFISNARSEKRSNRVIEIAGIIGSYIGSEVTVVTSYQLEDRRSKPDKMPYEKAAELMCIPAENLCHIGDQIIKDVLGANRAGYGASVLLPPYGPNKEDGRVKYLQRPVEMALRPLLGVPLRYSRFGQPNPARRATWLPMPLKLKPGEAREHAA